MIAIVIPFYKIDFFENCLSSLANQTEKKFRVYIGNDNSPDDPDHLIEKYSELLNINYTKFNINYGKSSLVKQWQRCIKKINGEEWVLLLGDDDELSENCVAEFYNKLSKHKDERVEVFRFASQVIDKKGIKSSAVFYHPELESSVDFFFRKLNGSTRSSLSEYVFKSSVLSQVGFKGFPLGWHSDDLAILEFSKFGNVLSINEAIVLFRNSGINITSSVNNLLEKNRASFLFFFYLLYKRRNYFSGNQRLILFDRFEKSYANDKKSLTSFLKFTWISFHNSSFNDYFLFWVRQLKKI